MSFKYGNNEIKKVIFKKDGQVISSDVNKVIWGPTSTVVFEKTATYKLTPYYEVGWSGYVTNDEWYDDEIPLETLIQGETGQITLTYGVSVTKNGSPYTIKIGDGALLEAEDLQAAVYFGSSQPTSKNQLKDIYSASAYYKYNTDKFTSTYEVPSSTTLCADKEGSNNNYWWIVFRGSGLTLSFKGSNFTVPDFFISIKSDEAAFSPWNWTPLGNSKRRGNLSEYTVIA